MYEFNIDWYEVAQTGFINRNTKYYFDIAVFDEAYMGIWHDISMSGYNWGVCCMITTVVLCLIQLIAINQLTEEQSITYLKALGPLGKKFSFRTMVLGLVLPLAGPMSLRIFATMQTFGGFFHFIISGVIVTCVLYSVYRTVLALYVCVHESEAYDPICLKYEECTTICKAYLKQFPDNYTMEGYFNNLTYVTPMKYKVPLTYACKVRAMKAFYLCMCQHENMPIKEEALTKMVLIDAASFKLDHKGQEMELGDEPEQILHSLRTLGKDKHADEFNETAMK
jgi:hypothetical protein